MGTTSFLLNQSPTSPNTLPETIAELRNASDAFKGAWKRGQYKRAGDVSAAALAHFDHIISVIMRARDEKKRHAGYAASQFAIELQAHAGMMVKGITMEDQDALSDIGPGNGRLPPGTQTIATLENVLNKIKHASRSNLNFRIDAQENHFFYVCALKLGSGEPESIVELNVEEFCDLCDSISQHI